jgi:hypothetical protein
MDADAAALADAAARLRSLAEEMAAAAPSLIPPGAAESPPDPALLTAVWDLYTMDDERAVHAELFGGFEAPAASAEDIDDMFF